MCQEVSKEDRVRNKKITKFAIWVVVISLIIAIISGGVTFKEVGADVSLSVISTGE